jgi:membrane protein
LLEFVLIALGMAALFHYVPKHPRALAPCAWSAACSSLSASPARSGCSRSTSADVSTYSMIYGAFATVPIFLIWIYLCWAIVLLGAVIAAYAPVRGRA